MGNFTGHKLLLLKTKNKRKLAQGVLVLQKVGRRRFLATGDQVSRIVNPKFARSANPSAVRERQRKDFTKR
jgi:hypothetical protein